MKIFRLTPKYDDESAPDYRFGHVIIAANSAESAGVLFKQRLDSVFNEPEHTKAFADGTVEEIDIQNEREGAVFAEEYSEYLR